MKPQPNKLIVAVSGGVDSVVLLDLLAKTQPRERLIVAHFEHGIRGEQSRADARFVAALSKSYGVECMIGHGNLTQNASEYIARKKRYEFLRELAKQHDGIIATAHHRDDYLGSVAVNLTRGTGWRGLAVMNAADIVRPLKKYTKTEIFDYAVSHHLEYVEDSTNRDPRYLRNRLRPALVALSDDTKTKLEALIIAQQRLAHAIDEETTRLMAHNKRDETDDIDRYFLAMIDRALALELLQAVCRAHHQHQTCRALAWLHHAVLTLQPGRTHVVSGQLRVRMTRCGATIRTTDKSDII